MKDSGNRIDANDINKSLQLFGWVDYIVFLLMVISCGLIGVYYGFIEKKFKKDKVHNESNKSEEVAQEYLMGGRQMAVIPGMISDIYRGVSEINFVFIVFMNENKWLHQRTVYMSSISIVSSQVSDLFE